MLQSDLIYLTAVGVRPLSTNSTSKRNEQLQNVETAYATATSGFVELWERGVQKHGFGHTFIGKVGVKMAGVGGPGTAFNYAVNLNTNLENGQTIYKAGFVAGGQTFTGLTSAGVMTNALIAAGVLAGFPLTAPLVFTAALGSAVFLGFVYEPSNEIVGEFYGNVWDVVTNANTYTGAYLSLPYEDVVGISVATGYPLSLTSMLNPSSNEMYSLKLYSNRPGITKAQVALDAGQALNTDPDRIIPIPRLRPSSPINVEDAEGSDSFELVDGDPTETARNDLGDRASLSSAGVLTATAANGAIIGVVDKNALLTIADETLGDIVINAQQFFRMLGNRAVAFAEFAESIVEAAIANSGGILASQGPQLIAQIVAGVLTGRDIEDVAHEFAVRTVAAGAVDTFVRTLTGENVNFFDSLKGIQGKPTAAVDAISGALTAVAVTAILNGRDAGFEDYARAAATASVQRIISRGVDAYFQQEGIQNLLGRGGAGAAGAGVATALVYLASSVISGQGINEDTLRGAATAGAVAAVSFAIASSAAVGAVIGTAIPVPVLGTVIGAALGLAIGKLFPHGGEKIYNSSTVSRFIQPKEDGTGNIIIGLREAGALLMAGIGNDDLLGTVGKDVLVGNDKPNVINGSDGDDMLEGRGNDDALIAGTGNDHIEAGEGDDYAEGNDGNDKIYGNAGDDKILAGTGNDIIYGGSGQDNIEGEDGDDQISGDADNDVIVGGNGNDAINGGAGDDVIEAGPGDDVVDGSADNDEIRGGDGSDRLLGGAGSDAIHGDADNDIILGNEGNDVLYGDLGDDILDGGEDADLLYAGLGNDVAFGQEGDDHIYGELGNDYIVGGPGKDILVGGEGDDVYIFARGDGDDTIEDEQGNDIVRLANYVEDEITFSKDNADLIMSTAPNGFDRLRIKNQLQPNSTTPIEVVVLADGTAIDLTTISFDSNDAVTYSMSTLDSATLLTQTSFSGTWQAADDDDSYLTYNPSSSWYHRNFDTSVISDATEKQMYNDVQVRRTTVKHKKWYGRTTLTIYIYDYFPNHLVGTSGSDRIVGQYWHEEFFGLNGFDQIYGNGDIDWLYGGNDPDVLFGGSEADIIMGEEGHDKIYGGTGEDTIDGGNGNDTLFGEWDSDTIQGNNGDDFISGGPGTDDLSGGPGHDEIHGDEGDDRINGGDGNDFIIGGVGNDIPYGGKGRDYIDGGDGNDDISGDEDNDVLRGEAGADNIHGGTGDDFLIGGTGADTLDGGSGTDTTSYSESTAGININLQTGVATGGHAEGDTLTQIENVIGTDYNDILIGNSAVNRLVGGYGNDDLQGNDGNDELQGGAGADRLDGGDGFDKVSYQDSASGVTIDLAAGTGKYGHAEGDVLLSMEHIVGSNFDDTFIVGNSTSTFEGGAGRDSMTLLGNAADYEIILDRNILTARHRVNNQIYTFKDGESVKFDDVAYGPEDFPVQDDAKIMMVSNGDQGGTYNNAIILPQSTYNVSLETDAIFKHVIIHADGSYQYSTELDFIGEDTFAIRITDPATRLMRIQHVDVQCNLNAHTTERIIFEPSPNIEYRSIDRCGDGSYVLAWYEESSNDQINEIWFQHYTKNFTPVGNEILITSTYHGGNTDRQPGEGWLHYPMLAVLQNGNIILIWQQYGTVLDGSRRIIGPPVIMQQLLTREGVAISSINTLSAVDRVALNHVIIKLQNGGFAVTYNDRPFNPSLDVNPFGDGVNNGTFNNIVLQIFDSAGDKVRESIIELGTFQNSIYKLTEFPNGDLLLTWLTNYDDAGVAALIVHPDGSRSEIINLATQFPFVEAQYPEQLEGRNYYDVAVLSNDLFAMAFPFYSIDDNSDYTLVQVINSSGKLVNKQIIPGYDIDAISNFVKITPLREQYFLVAWKEDSSEGQTAAIPYETTHAQLFDFACNPIGNKFVLIDKATIGRDAYKVFEVGKGNLEVFYPYPARKSRIISVPIPLIGGMSSDYLQANSFNNTLIGNGGADILCGGDGLDTLFYLDSPGSVQIDLGDTIPTTIDGISYSRGFGGHAEGDLIRDVENIIGSPFNDTLSGYVGPNVINGGPGFDSTHYSGNSNDYAIVMRGEKVVITDLNIVDGRDDGTDEFTQMEQFVFNNRVIHLEDFPRVISHSARLRMNTALQGILGAGNNLTFVLEAQPVNGNITLLPSGSYLYEPLLNFEGIDSFSYLATNAIGVSSYASYDIKVLDPNKMEVIELASFQVNEASDGGNLIPYTTTLANKNVLITWGKTATLNNDGAFGRILNDIGKIVSDDFKVDYLNKDSNGAHATTAVGMTDNTFVVFWEDNGANYTDSSSLGIFGQKFDINGFPLNSAFQVNTVTYNEQRNPQAQMLSNGNIAIIWTTEPSSGRLDIAGKVIDQQGISLSSEFSIGSYVSELPRILAIKNGEFIVAWDYKNGGSDYDIYCQRFYSNGTINGEIKRLNSATTNDQRSPALVETENGFAAAWIDFSNQSGDGALANVVIQKFDENNTAITAEKIINTAPFSAINRNWDYHLFQHIDIIPIDKGNYFITWKTPGYVYGRAVNQDLNQISDQVLIHKQASFYKHSASYIAEGNVVVAASEHHPSGDYNVRAKYLKIGYPVFDGTDGNDVLNGGGENNVLLGGLGNNTYVTGGGEDTIVLSVNPDGTDIIEDFDPEHDVIDTSNYNFMINGFSDLRRYIINDNLRGVSTDTVIRFDNGHTIILKNVILENVGPSLFLGTSNANSLPVARLWHWPVVTNSTATIDVLSQASDLDNDPLTLDSITSPFNGNALIQNSSIVYTPEIGFEGEDRIEYVISDNHGGITARNLTLTVAAPIILPPSLTPTASPTTTLTSTATPSVTAAATSSTTESVTITPTSSYTQTATPTVTPTSSLTLDASASETNTYTQTMTSTVSSSNSNTLSSSALPTVTPTSSLSSSAQLSPSIRPSSTTTDSGTATGSTTVSPSATPASSSSGVRTPTVLPSPSDFEEDETPTASMNSVKSGASQLDIPWYSPALVVSGAISALNYLWKQAAPDLSTASASHVSDIALYTPPIEESMSEQTDDSICKPMLVDGVPALACAEAAYTTYVFPKVSEFSVVSSTPTNVISGDTYDVSTCRPVEFYGRPSVCCEGEDTSMIYTPNLPARPFENASSQIQLAAVGVHLASKAASWAKDKCLGKETENSKAMVRSEDVKVEMDRLKQRLTELEKDLKRLPKETIRQQQFKWIQYTIEDYLVDLAELGAKKQFEASELEELTASVEEYINDSQPEIKKALDDPAACSKVSETQQHRFFATANAPQRVDFAALAANGGNSTMQQSLLQQSPVQQRLAR